MWRSDSAKEKNTLSSVEIPPVTTSSESDAQPSSPSPQPVSERVTRLAKLTVSEVRSSLNPRLYVWDFAGQEEYYSTHHIFLSEGAIHVLVLKIVDDKGDLYFDEKLVRFWLHSIRAHAPLSEILVIGTFGDLIKRDERANTIEQWQSCICTILQKDGLLLSYCLERTPIAQCAMIEVVSCTDDGPKVRERIQSKLMECSQRSTKQKLRTPLSYLVALDVLTKAADGAYIQI